MIVAAAASAAVTASALAGLRWSSVHLFTLGVLTPLVVAFSQQFARSVTRTRTAAHRWLLPTLIGGAGTLVVALPSGWLVATAIAATSVTVAVSGSLWELRAMTRTAGQARFAWLVRTYVHAHLAFLVAALLGAAMGLRSVPSAWYGAVRLAHLHVNALGWVGLTVLATVVFFAPAMLRTRLTDRAQAVAAPALRTAAWGVVLAGVGLLGSGTPGVTGTAARFLAAGGLLGYAGAVVVVGCAVVDMTRRAHPAPARPLLVGALGWFVVAAVGDAAAVAGGAWRWLDGLGLAFGLGVAAQLIVAVALYLLPSLRGRGFAVRDALIARTERGMRLRAAAFNAATLAVVLGTMIPPAAAQTVTSAGWTLLAVVVVHTMAIAAWPVTAEPDQAKSSVAKRYRDAQAQVSADV